MGTVVSPESELRKQLEKLKGPLFENNVSYMYLDSQGYVTVGVGHNLDAAKDHTELPFRVARLERKAVKGGDKGKPIADNPVKGRLATKQEIKNDYDFLKAHLGLKAFNPTNKELKNYTTLELKQEDIDAIFVKDINKHYAIAIKEFGKEFDGYPVMCQVALFDIAFNCGSFKTFQTTFVPAIKGLGAHKGKSMAERWKYAASVCSRGKVSAERNARIKEWLLTGAEG